MRNRGLHDALRNFTLDLAGLLTRAIEGGAELPFEVLEEGGGSGSPAPVLYRYRPLTGEFLAGHWEAARALETYGRACRALAGGAGPYLRHRGLAGTDPEDALFDVAERLFEDASSFTLDEDRFRRVHAEVDAALEAGTVAATVVAPLHGVRIATARVELGQGLALVRRRSIASPPTALEGTVRAAEGTTEPDADDAEAPANPLDVFCMVERELPSDRALPVDEARNLFRRVLTALRLCGAGGTALGPLAWARTDGGAWHPVALGVSARARPESWELRHSEESELHELLDILPLSRHGPVAAWALGRFEMGCDRELETEALTDYLLALRALLADPGAGGDAAMALRLGALCAPEEERRDLQERVEAALALERRSMLGTASGAGSLDSPRVIVREIEQHLRALLRDVLCGYLDEDLRRAADGILVAAGGPEEGIRAFDTRSEDRPGRSEHDTQELDLEVLTTTSA